MRVPASIVILMLSLNASQAQILVTGAGATFPYPIYSKWFDEFHRVRPDAVINYQPVGSGAGIRQLIEGLVDFGATDRPLSDAELAALPAPVLHFPTVVGGVVPIYNLPGFRGELRFTPEVLAAIFRGQITRWTDPVLAKANPRTKLPDAPILAIHRADGSGTTYVFTDFLSKTVPEWRQTVGSGASVAWGAGVGAKGNAGVAAMVQGTAYAVGYVELSYAIQNRIACGRVLNSAGRYVRADAASIRAAAVVLADSVPEDFRSSITNAPGGGAYPLASYTWLLTPARIADPAKRRVVTEFLRWMLTQGQVMAEPLGYASLPRPVLERAVRAIDRLN